MLPPLFAVWRPCLNRWQLVSAEGGRLRAAYGPWIRATVHTTDPRFGANAVRVAGDRVHYMNQHIALWLLDGRDIVMQRVPVLRVDGRRLPRGCV
jgi:hypothetical protein